MSSAYYLAKQLEATGEDSTIIHVWEKEKTLGGLAGSFRTENFTVEKFYHHIFRRDQDLQMLIRDVGLEDEIVWQPAATGAYYFRQPYRLSSPIDLLRFTPLPFVDRLRLGWMTVQAKSVKDWRKLDDISAKDYICRTAGQRVYNVVWAPLFHGKFGKHAERVSAAWLWSKLIDRGGSRNSQGHELLGYLQGSMGRMFEAIAQYLRDRGHQLHTGHAVERLIGREGVVTALETAEGRFATDVVLGCTQLPDLAELLPEQENVYQNALQTIDFLANVCLVLTLNRPLSEFYWTNVTETETPFVGIIEQSNWARKSDFNHKSLVYISAYVDGDDPRLAMEAEALIERYLPAVKKMFPHFSPAAVEHSAIWTAQYAQPIVHTGYRHSVPDIQTPISNLFVSSMAQIYPHDRQMSNGVALAKKAVASALHYLHP